MKLHIANLTQQNQDFVYRVPETTGLRKQMIGIGEQIVISGDLNRPQIDAIIEQHAKYGLVAVEEIDRSRPFVGLCYSIDKPVPAARMLGGIEHNTGVLTARGREIRKEMAVATNSMLENQDGPGALQRLEMLVIEEEGKAPSDNPISEGIIVDRQSGPGETKGARPRASGGKRGR